MNESSVDGLQLIRFFANESDKFNADMSTLKQTDRLLMTRLSDLVIEAIAKMRNGRVSLTQAAREARVSPRTVTKYGKSALRKSKSGKYTVKKNDTLLRVLSIPTADGPGSIAIRGSKQASLLGEYWNAVHRYLQTGDTSKLKAFHGQKITDASGVEIPLIVDPAVLNRLGPAGVLSFESIYTRTT